MNKKVIIPCVVITIIICIILSAVSIFAAFFFLREPEIQTQDSGPVLTLPAATTTATALETDEVDTEPDTSTNIPPEIEVEMALIQNQVIEERGLEATGVFTQVLYTKEQLNQRLIEDFEEDYDPQEEAETAIVLDVFGLLNADFDLYNFYLELFTEQIAGFYDNETKEMVVILGEGFQGPQRLTYAHEYTHALQDQNYNIRNGLMYNDEACETDTERCAAIQALMEGDASLSELNWFQEYATMEDKREILTFYDNLESPMLESAPSFIAEDLLFPYDTGYTFVEYLYQRGGWNAVNQAYAAPPVTTEQILHPEKYPDDQPIPVSIPDLIPDLGEDWQEIDRNVMGEWYTYLILAHGLDENARLSEAQAEEAAEGWGGDTYVVYHHQEQNLTAMVFKTIWESSTQAEEFTDAFLAYANERFGKPVERTSDLITWETGSGVHLLKIDNVYTTWVAAPDLTLATTIMNTLR